MILHGFELIKFNRYGKKGFKLRFIADGYCIEERKYYGDFSKFFIDGLKILIINNLKFLCRLNYKISKHMVMEAKKKGLMPPEGTSYLDMQRKIRKLIS